MNRRDALGALGSWLALSPMTVRQTAVQATDSLAPPLRDPDLAGQTRTPVTSHENDPFIVGVEQKLRCTCGCNLSVYTCRTTDFVCKVSPELHRRVVDLATSGKGEQAILETFVSQYGETVLMAPPKRGFNLAAYFVPGALILAVGAGMVWTLTRRIRLARRTAAAPVSGATPRPPAADSRLDDELRSLES